MDEERFEPVLGRVRAPPSRRGRRYLQTVLAAATRRGMRRRSKPLEGSRVSRGTAAARLLGSRGRPSARSRRAIVKTRLVRLSGSVASARAHLRYIQRDGVSRDGAPGRLYGADSDDADGKAFLERCRDDRHQFRIIVSAEDGDAYDDVRPLIRRFVQRMEQDLGTRLDWVAADHADTLHPHTHLIVRGKDEHGQNLVIAPDYIARGMRERVSELVTLDLGPPTALEIAARRRREVSAERLTPLDRALLREQDSAREVDAAGRPMVEHALRAGRLRKLEGLGLAEPLGGGRWRLAAELETSLRAIGERGDIIRTMQRAFTAAGVERAASDRRLFDPRRDAPLVGRVIARGLADELRDRHFLLVDGTDGRAHFVDIGAGDQVDPLPQGAIVRIASRATGLRQADRTIAEVAAAHGGRYSVELHLQHDPSASRAFAEAHVRRLEALRRGRAGVERDVDGSWSIPGDHLARIEAHGSRTAKRQPVTVELLSPLALEQLAERAGATWLDRELASEAPVPLRDAGFGKEARAALQARRAWLLQQGLAEEEGDRVRIRAGTLATLERRELAAAAAAIGRDSGKAFVEAGAGTPMEGVVRRRVDLASGRFAMIETDCEFSLVPWRPVLGRAVGRRVAGVIRERGTSWTIERGRGLGR